MSSEHRYLERLARGLIQRPAAPRPRACKIVAESFLFLLDHSDSMSSQCGRTSRLGATLDATLALLDARRQKGVDDSVGVIVFNTHAELILPFTPCLGNRWEIDHALRSIRADGATDLRAPFVLAAKMLPPGGRVHIVMLSDGLESPDPRGAARHVKDRGAIIETIGVGNKPAEVAEEVLKATASVLDGKVLYRFISDAGELANYFRTEIANRLVRRSDS